jgi:hypothetical protein
MLSLEGMQNLVDHLLELVAIRQVQGERDRLARKLAWKVDRLAGDDRRGAELRKAWAMSRIPRATVASWTCASRSFR